MRGHPSTCLLEALEGVGERSGRSLWRAHPPEWGPDGLDVARKSRGAPGHPDLLSKAPGWQMCPCATGGSGRRTQRARPERRPAGPARHRHVSPRAGLPPGLVLALGHSPPRGRAHFPLLTRWLAVSAPRPPRSLSCDNDSAWAVTELIYFPIRTQAINPVRDGCATPEHVGPRQAG